MYKDKFVDQFLKFLSFIGVCMPNFWLGFLLILAFCVHLKWFKAFGIDDFSHLILPSFTISFMSVAINSRLIRANILEVKE